MDTAHSGSGRGPVLVVDDEETSQLLARAVLQELGYEQVMLANGGVAALALLDGLAQPPELVVCDIFMPNTDGIELVNALARRHFQGGLVLVTGGDSQYLVIAKRIARFHGLHLLGSIVKPLTVQSMQQVLWGGAQA